MNIYSLTDTLIQQRIGDKIRALRLRQNITQVNLASDAQVSLSSVKKIEKGQIGSFDSLIRVLRVLGKLDVLQQLVEEEEMSPNEYYEFVNSKKKKSRQRATSVKKTDNDKEESEW
ncbi:helix-turn-helix domain-containing protein [uncultured Duncaniella sp.]|uniref:helix-turn-helix domain-containing protein n=2 Tax=uncultured Duncaniella sp. TaxID=2768039 RepID=UPI002619D420|nr:helix-turn-helix domain-containing protein [uncultured Duncaniella sp.]